VPQPDCSISARLAVTELARLSDFSLAGQFGPPNGRGSQQDRRKGAS